MQLCAALEKIGPYKIPVTEIEQGLAVGKMTTGPSMVKSPRAYVTEISNFYQSVRQCVQMSKRVHLLGG